MTLDGICAGHVQNSVTQPYTWPAQILLVMAHIIIHVIMITCVGLRKRRARGRICPSIATTPAWSRLARFHVQ